MSVVPPKVDASLKIAQITQLVRDNQLVTALIVFLLWQAGAIASAGTYIGGVC
jgi:hypothetical protein